MAKFLTMTIKVSMTLEDPAGDIKYDKDELYQTMQDELTRQLDEFGGYEEISHEVVDGPSWEV